MQENKLSPNFLNELFRLCLLKASFFEKTSQYLKYQYLPTPEYKEILKSMIDSYSLNSQLPSFGLMYERFKENNKIVAILSLIKEAEIVPQELLLKQLEIFIKEIRFSGLWDEVKTFYDKGNRESGMKLMAKESTDIVEFSISKEDGKFLRVFRDFDKKMLEKEIKKESGELRKKKIPTGILPFDLVSGGVDKKETALWILRSGVGKSTILKFIGMWACQLGYDVLHIQLEGSEEECFDKYTQAWSALPYTDIKYSNIDTPVYKKLKGIIQDMTLSGKDIDIKAVEQFDEYSMLDVRDCIVEYIKENGKPPDLLVLDSIDLAHPGDGVRYGIDTQSIKMKLQNSSRKFKNICNEFDIAGHTTTQTADVQMSIWNDPDKHLTRSDSMGDKNIANSYSFVVTGNQTIDEEKKKLMRLYFDKVRHFGLKQRIYPICTNYEHGRAFDLKRTKTVFKNIYTEND